jgi:hypothetical protein
LTSFSWSYSPAVPLFGLFDPEDEGTTILQNAGDQYSLIQHIIAEDLNILFLNAMFSSEF